MPLYMYLITYHLGRTRLGMHRRPLLSGNHVIPSVHQAVFRVGHVISCGSHTMTSCTPCDRPWHCDHVTTQSQSQRGCPVIHMVWGVPESPSCDPAHMATGVNPPQTMQQPGNHILEMKNLRCNEMDRVGGRTRMHNDTVHNWLRTTSMEPHSAAD